MQRLALVLLIAACGSEKTDPKQPPPDKQEAKTPAVDAKPPDPPAKPIIDAQLAATCSVSFDCSLSHPGLGSSGNGRSVDLAKCTRLVTSYSGPYNDGASPPEPNAKPPPAPVPTPVAADQCKAIAAQLATITDADVKDAQESAQVDTTACGLTVLCPAGGAEKIRVQRQTTSGPSRVEQLIRSL